MWFSLIISLRQVGIVWGVFPLHLHQKAVGILQVHVLKFKAGNQHNGFPPGQLSLCSKCNIKRALFNIFKVVINLSFILSVSKKIKWLCVMWETEALLVATNPLTIIIQPPQFPSDVINVLAPFSSSMFIFLLWFRVQMSVFHEKALKNPT